MKQALFIDCCIRGEQSRTKQLAEAFFAALSPEYEVTRVTQEELLALQPMDAAALQTRDSLLAAGTRDHPDFRLARQIAEADLVVMAAPFWDLSFPSTLRVYLEHTTVEGITFRYTDRGPQGLCRAEHLVFLTTRGGLYGENDPREQGTPYLRAMSQFYNLGEFRCVAANGLDVQGYDGAGSLQTACEEAAALAKTL